MFIALLKSIVRDGSLRVVDAAGRTHAIGDSSPPRAVIRLKSPRLAYTLMRNPGLALGEAYMDGQLTVEEGSLYDFLAVVAKNLKVDRHGWLALIARVTRGLKQYNPVGKAQQNVAHHYDLSAQLYDLFLDADRQYSCAYFASPGTAWRRRS